MIHPFHFHVFNLTRVHNFIINQKQNKVHVIQLMQKSGKSSYSKDHYMIMMTVLRLNIHLVAGHFRLSDSIENTIKAK
jgi:hypothetical protein